MQKVSIAPICLSLTLILMTPIVKSEKSPTSITKSLIQNVKKIFNTSDSRVIQPDTNKSKPKTKNPNYRIIKKAGKEKDLDSSYYRKISSEAAKKELSKYIDPIAELCSLKYKTPFKRINVFKDQILALRNHLLATINSSQIEINTFLASKNMYEQIREDNFPVIKIIAEDTPIKDKTFALKTSFRSFYLYYHNRNSREAYAPWAQHVANGIDCIDGQMQ